MNWIKRQRAARLTRRQAESAAYVATVQAEYECGDATERANGDGASALTTLALTDVPWTVHGKRP